MPFFFKRAHPLDLIDSTEGGIIGVTAEWIPGRGISTMGTTETVVVVVFAVSSISSSSVYKKKKKTKHYS